MSKKVLVYNSAQSNVSNRLGTTGINLHPESSGSVFDHQLEVFPNPYTGKTEIAYTLKEDLNVFLKVYNVLGKKIQLLVNGEQKSGEYKYSFSAIGLGYSSGIYTLKLRVGDSVYTRQLMEY